MIKTVSDNAAAIAMARYLGITILGEKTASPLTVEVQRPSEVHDLPLQQPSPSPIESPSLDREL